ncbi:TenA family protein [Lysinibacter cavernae]|uniref:Thiaminase/transcriptional activator TenA n=1 Tax=Lysinibacter cavernae TaxID=1640652 RepID=A0A7X5TT21_9MICO|nr:TenA family protein [Lysinibacter cavernae]NIH53064.1 thiaminase/transcriptional activator TenA [Lysinibacter cavernae]
MHGAITPTDRFTDHLWAETTDIREAIDSLEFLQRLGDGSLGLEDFRFYLEQDSLYLAGYAKALALLAARAPDPVTSAFWSTSAHDAAVVEASLHAELLAAVDAAPAAPASPTCLGYVSYLIATAATAPYPVAAAAVLPCFWLYADVSSRLALSAAEVLEANPEHPFAKWVASYDGEEFQSAVREARRVVDEAHSQATDEQRAAMVVAYQTASEFELLFWDTALNRQPWPVSQ